MFLFRLLAAIFKSAYDSISVALEITRFNSSSVSFVPINFVFYILNVLSVGPLITRLTPLFLNILEPTEFECISLDVMNPARFILK